MRHLLLSLCATSVLCACGGSDTSTPSIDGTWSDSSQVMGSNLTLRLTSQSTAVVGTGTYAIEAGRSGTLSVTGEDQSSQIALTLVYDYGPTVSYTATFADDNHLSGKLTFTDGSSQDAVFVRQ